jgi:hypothetical protein
MGKKFSWIGKRKGPVIEEDSEPVEVFRMKNTAKKRKPQNPTQAIPQVEEWKENAQISTNRNASKDQYITIPSIERELPTYLNSLNGEIKTIEVFNKLENYSF